MARAVNNITKRTVKEKYFMAFGLAFIVACALFVPYIIWDKGYFIFYGDFNAQQIPFYKLAHAAVRNLDIGWSFGTDLGSNFVSSYSFYLLGSPFFWLTIPFPNDFVPHLMGPLLILKFSFASLTAYAYITRFVKNKNYAVLGAFMYAFSGFSVYNIFFNHFHEAIIFFPLLLLSLELLMTENRRGVMLCSVAICSLVNYYFFFGMVIFVVIYFVIRCLSGDWNVNLKRGEAAYTCSRFLGIIIEAVLGLVISAVILLPSVYGILENNRVGSTVLGFNGIVYDKQQLYTYILQSFFFPPDIPARMVFFPGVERAWSSVAGWLPLFGMTGVISWLQYKRSTWQRRIIIVSMIIAFIPVLNQAFSAFNYSYYARWFYMPVLIMALVTAMSFEDDSIKLESGWKWSAGITLAIILLIGFMPASRGADGSINEFGVYNKSYSERFWVYCGIAVAALVLTSLLLRLRKNSKKSFAKIAIIFCCIVSLAYSSYYIYLGKLVRTDTKTFIIPTLIENDRQMTVNDANGQKVLATELDDARIDVYEGTENTTMYLGQRGIQTFHSIVPGSVMNFYKYVGVTRTVNSKPPVNLYAIRGLLSVKYVINYTGESKQFYKDGVYAAAGYKMYSPGGVAETKEDTEQSGYYVYENTNFVPYGFTYDHYMTQEFCDGVDKEKRSEAMMKAMLLSDEQIEKYGDILSNVSDEVTVEQINEDYDYNTYKVNCRDRAKNACSSFSTGKSEFTAKIALGKDNLVFFSVPYEKGWSATVDGQAVDIENVNVGFMAVKVKGDGQEHTIHFTYKTPGLKAGAAASCGAIVLSVIYIAYWSVKRKKQNAAAQNEPGGVQNDLSDAQLQSADGEVRLADYLNEGFVPQQTDGGDGQAKEPQMPEGPAERASDVKEDKLGGIVENVFVRKTPSDGPQTENPADEQAKSHSDDAEEASESGSDNSVNTFIIKDKKDEGEK